jgi:hypothetical protein
MKTMNSEQITYLENKINIFLVFIHDNILSTCLNFDKLESHKNNNIEEFYKLDEATQLRLNEIIINPKSIINTKFKFNENKEIDNAIYLTFNLMKTFNIKDFKGIIKMYITQLFNIDLTDDVLNKLILHITLLSEIYNA